MFGLVASVIMGGLIMMISIQYSYNQRNIYNEQALSIAEAGIEYYKWHLAHNPDDLTDGTGLPGPYEHEYSDPQGGVVGSYSISIATPSGEMVEITSTGWTTAEPNIKRTIQAIYGKPALTRFSFLHNSNVWFGQGMTVVGPVMVNGGIRQDGINTSTLSTPKETYTCGIESGCDPAETKPGIWGNGGPDSLWIFPDDGIDFEGINVDFATLKSTAQTQGIYFDSSAAQGYHLVFNADGTADVYTVTETSMWKGWSHDYGCENLYQNIDNETNEGSYDVSGNPVFFFEDNLWIEGTLNGETTVAAARFPLDSYEVNIWIPNNIVYLDRSGAHKLGLIAQHDIVMTKDVPEDLEINGALLAQSSRVLRHHYNYHDCKEGNPEMKDELTIYGSVISNLIAYWNFSGGGGGQPTSGFVKRNIEFDPNMYYDPPPFFPSDGELEMVDWQEVDNP
jgi:hypothetical protein